MLYRGVAYARRHQIRLHMRMMQATYIAALVIAGLFTFYPGRIMYKVAFGRDGADPQKLAVFALVLFGVTALAWLVMRWRRSGDGRKFLAAH
jgi:hypothetical protein